MNWGKNIHQSSQNNLIHIDVFVSVVDNYWDVGFATELLISLEREFPWVYYFRIFTDNREKTEQFFLRNKTSLPSYEIHSIWTHDVKSFSLVIFLLFHFPIPDIEEDWSRLILRIDYLSFDPIWIENQWREHILSTARVPIYEMIPSLLPWWAGYISPCILDGFSRSDFIEKYSLPQDIEHKKWMTIFVYPETLARFDFSKHWEDTLYFILGEAYDFDAQNIISLPFLTLERYHTLLSLSDMNIVRWEVSAIAGMVIGKPFLWDMYKGKWWFPQEMSIQFLDYYDFSSEYREKHNQLNSINNQIDIHTIEHVLQHEKAFYWRNYKNNPTPLVNTLKKYIDRFYFSL